MSLTSEEVHWVAGALVTLLALIMILSECRVIAARWARYLIPAALLVWGMESLLDPLIHGAALPKGYSAEMFQHYLIGVLLLVAGSVEWLRARGLASARAWAFALPAGLFALGLIFFFHAQHEAEVPAIVLIVQHRIMGLTLMTAGVTKALAAIGHHRTRVFAVAWLVPLLLFGLELLVYTEAGTSSGHGH